MTPGDLILSTLLLSLFLAYVFWSEHRNRRREERKRSEELGRFSEAKRAVVGYRKASRGR